MQKSFEILVGKLDYVKEIRPAESVDCQQDNSPKTWVYHSFFKKISECYVRLPNEITSSASLIFVETHGSDLVCRLTYNDDVAAGQLAVFQGASDEHI